MMPGTLGLLKKNSFLSLSVWPFLTLDALYARIRPSVSLDVLCDLGLGSESLWASVSLSVNGGHRECEWGEVCAVPVQVLAIRSFGGTLATFSLVIGCPGWTWRCVWGRLVTWEGHAQRAVGVGV